MLTRPWRDPSRLIRIQFYGSVTLMLTAIASFFTDKVTRLLLVECCVLVPVALFGLARTWFDMHRLTKRMKIQRDALKKAVAENRPMCLNDLPPEMHEDIQVTWARRVLAQKDEH